jgi:TolA-binding protein
MKLRSILASLFCLSVVIEMSMATPPPSQSTPQSRMWQSLSHEAAADLTSDKTQAAIDSFLKKFSDHPKAADARYIHAERQFKLRQYQNAQVAFEKFIALFPSHPLTDSALYRLGECYYNGKAFKSAFAAWERLANSYPRSALTPDALRQMAFIRMKEKEWGRADELFKQVRSRFPE